MTPHAFCPIFLKSRFATLDNFRFPGHLKHLSHLSACFLSASAHHALRKESRYGLKRVSQFTTPPFSNHSLESGYWFVPQRGVTIRYPPSLHRPKLDNKTLLSFTHTKKHLAHLQSAFFFFLQRLTMSPCPSANNLLLHPRDGAQFHCRH